MVYSPATELLEKLKVFHYQLTIMIDDMNKMEAEPHSEAEMSRALLQHIYDITKYVEDCQKLAIATDIHISNKKFPKFKVFLDEQNAFAAFAQARLEPEGVTMDDILVTGEALISSHKKAVDYLKHEKEVNI